MTERENSIHAGWTLAWLKLFMLLMGLALYQAGIATLVAETMMLVAGIGIVFLFLVAVIHPPEELSLRGGA